MGDMLKDTLDWTGSLILAEKMTQGRPRGPPWSGSWGAGCARPRGVPPVRLSGARAESRSSARDNRVCAGVRMPQKLTVSDVMGDAKGKTFGPGTIACVLLV